MGVRFANSSESIDSSWIEFKGGGEPRSMEDIMKLLFSSDGGFTMSTRRGGAEGFLANELFGSSTRAAELFSKRKMGTLDIDGQIGDKATDKEMLVLNHLSNEKLTEILNQVAKDAGPTEMGQPFVGRLLKDIEFFAGKEKADMVKESLQTVYVDEWMRRAFPPVKKINKETQSLSRRNIALLDKAIERGLASDRSQARSKILMDSPDMTAFLRQEDPSFSKANFQEFKFNMGIEIDMIGAGLFIKDNKEALKVVFGEKQFKVFEKYVEVLNMVGSQLDKTNINNIPSGYTTAMLLGRVYNAVKGVVSPRYLLGEKLIMDYRLNQANLLREILTDEEASKAILNVFRNDVVFNKKEIRKAQKRIFLHAASLGIRTKNADEYAKDLEKIAIEVRRRKPDDENAQKELLDSEQSMPTSTAASRVLGPEILGTLKAPLVKPYPYGKFK